jgi:hypothetical protein
MTAADRPCGLAGDVVKPLQSRFRPLQIAAQPMNALI